MAHETAPAGALDSGQRLSNDNSDRITPIGDDGERLNQTDHLIVEGRDSASSDEASASRSTNNVNLLDAPAIPVLRYRRTSLVLLACYVPFLVVPWILTCIMAYRPPSFSTYYNQRGSFCEKKYLAILFWPAFVRVLNAIASVLVVPITSALLAHGAVVYSQRRKLVQKLNLKQTFALSDRAWADVPMLWGAYRRDNGTASHYLTLAALLIALSTLVVERTRYVNLQFAQV
jgi:hypothetical protein